MLRPRASQHHGLTLPALVVPQGAHTAVLVALVTGGSGLGVVHTALAGDEEGVGVDPATLNTGGSEADGGGEDGIGGEGAHLDDYCESKD